jgi:hypothetical protein
MSLATRTVSQRFERLLDRGIAAVTVLFGLALAAGTAFVGA